MEKDAKSEESKIGIELLRNKETGEVKVQINFTGNVGVTLAALPEILNLIGASLIHRLVEVGTPKLLIEIVRANALEQSITLLAENKFKDHTLTSAPCQCDDCRQARSETPAIKNGSGTIH